MFINTRLNLRSNYFIFLYYNEIVKQIIHIIYFGLWKSKIRLSFINKRFFFLTQHSILLSITKLNFWTFSFRFDIETIRYRSFIIEELVLSLTSLDSTVHKQCQTVHKQCQTVHKHCQTVHKQWQTVHKQCQTVHKQWQGCTDHTNNLKGVQYSNNVRDVHCTVHKQCLGLWVFFDNVCLCFW